MIFFKLFFLIQLSYSILCERVFKSVDTKVGEIRGQIGNDYTTFLGIPYGVVDKKDPFGTATPPPHFKTTYYAFKDYTICPQIVEGVPEGRIHCLNLNVYTPKLVEPNNTLPVMIFIHGGAFVEGNGRQFTYPPKYLIRHDVILVTINYRLGPYGFLCFPNSTYSNQGLKDQILAIRWVKDNIKSFGGDDENILLFGHSSGSISVDFHLLYNNDDLFNKVILQSGQAVSPYNNEATNSMLLAEKVGLRGENISVEQLIKNMSTIDTDEIIGLTRNFNFRPCIDEILITKKPKIENLENINIMLGGTTHEMLFIYPQTIDDFYYNFDFAPELKHGFSKIADDAIDDVTHFYYGNIKYNVINFKSDFNFNYPMERSVKYYLENNATVFRYLFSYDGKLNYMKNQKNITDAGSTHGDELGYLFENIDLFGNIMHRDEDIIDIMSYLWTNFAKYGDPTPSESPLVPVKWQPVTEFTRPYLQIDTNMGLFSGPFQKQMAFWDLFYMKNGMYSKGISLGEHWPQCKFKKNKALSIDLSKILLLVTFLLLWQ